MFIRDVIKKEDAKGELKLLYRMIDHSLGSVPPHFELFASIDVEAMKEFASYNQKMATHKSIDKNLLPHLRLAIANKECRSYCIAFNSNMFQNASYEIDEKQEFLMSKVLKSLYETELFNEDDLAELQTEGFGDKDFFDLLNYATNFMAKSKMIEVYLKKDKI